MPDDRLYHSERPYQCEIDVEDRASRSAGGVPAAYHCSLCGAEADSLDHLCAPERRRH
ncbi:MAG: hypothetical protein V1794_03585 [Candidatus Glassbacteria bacterium]